MSWGLGRILWTTKLRDERKDTVGSWIVPFCQQLFSFIIFVLVIRPPFWISYLRPHEKNPKTLLMIRTWQLLSSSFSFIFRSSCTVLINISLGIFSPETSAATKLVLCCSQSAAEMVPQYRDFLSAAQIWLRDHSMNLPKIETAYGNLSLFV